MLGCKNKIANRIVRGADFSYAIKAIPTMIVEPFANVKRHKRAFGLKYGHRFVITGDVAKNEFVKIWHRVDVFL